MLWRQWRLCIGWLKRWRHWEFWPPWLFYLRLLPPLFLLAVRYRSVLVVTAVNPGITRHGRFIVNRKSKKLAALPARSVPPFVLLRAAAGLAERLAQARAFAAAQGLPLVLKPDLGGRGSGVWIVRSLVGLERDVVLVDYDVLLQAFAPGEEYGVFWVRAPGREHGRIVSITRKALPSVVGDGVRTVAQLVLAHPRAVCFAPLLLHNLGRRAREIPAAGERVQVGELGTHSRGAQFRDACDCRTAALERTIAELAAIIKVLLPDVVLEERPPAPEKPKRGTLEIDRAREFLGFVPSRALDTGYRDYCAWYIERWQRVTSQSNAALV